MQKFVPLFILAGLVAIVGAGVFALGRYTHPSGFWVQYVSGAVEPWEGLDAAIEVLEARPPLDRLRCVKLAVYGPNDIIPTREGTVNVAGLTERDCVGGSCCYLVALRQLSDGLGGVQHACRSAFHHEFAEHVLPIETRGDENLAHTDPDLRLLGLDLAQMCHVIVAGRDPQD